MKAYRGKNITAILHDDVARKALSELLLLTAPFSNRETATVISEAGKTYTIKKCPWKFQ